jgi:transposase InsO family protein/transposase
VPRSGMPWPCPRGRDHVGAVTQATHLRVLLHARTVVGLAYGLVLGSLGNRGDPAERLLSEIATVEQRLRPLGESVRVLVRRLESIATAHRPRYSRTWVRQILRFQDRFGYACAQIATMFLVDVSTVRRWRRRRQRLGADLAFAPLPTPRPPNRRIADSVRQIVAQAHVDTTASLPLLAALLSRAGVRLGRTFVAASVDQHPRSPTPRDISPSAASHPNRGHSPGDDPFDDAANDADILAIENLAMPARASRPLTRLRHTLSNALAGRLAAVRRKDLEQSRMRLRRLRAEESMLLWQRGILRERMKQIPGRHRPRYSPDLRVEILELKHRSRLTHAWTSALFLVTTNTITYWNKAVDRVGGNALLQRPSTLVDLRAAFQRAARAVPYLTPRSYHEIADALARACEGLRVRRRPLTARHPQPSVSTGRTGGATHRRPRPLRARRPGHVCAMDVSPFQRLFNLPGLPYLAAIIDLHSRLILGWKLFASQPTGQDMAALLRAAVDRHGPPTHLITDHGAQFTSEEFEDATRSLGIEHRFGAIGESGSIAVMERFWRTLKELVELKHRSEIVTSVIAARVHLAMLWYNNLRPHVSLRLATPAERHFGLTPARQDSHPAPRGHLGELVQIPPLEVRFLDRDHHRLPYFLKHVA